MVLFAGGPLTFLPALKQAFVNALELSPGDWLEVEHGELLSAHGAALAAGGEAGQAAYSLSQLIGLIGSAPEGAVSEGRLAPLFDGGQEFQRWELERLRHRVEQVDPRQVSGECFLGIDFRLDDHQAGIGRWRRAAVLRSLPGQ